MTVLALVLLAAVPVSAQSCRSPDGLSGIDQYCEAVPAPGGRQGPSELGAGAPRGRGLDGLERTRDGAALRGFTERSLERQGGERSGSGTAGAQGTDAGTGFGAGRTQSDALWLIALALAGAVGLLALLRWLRRRARNGPVDPEPA